MGVTTVTEMTDGVLHTLFRTEQGGHEQVVLCQDRASGLKAVIAIHSTALGPALGGTRFHAYASDEEAVLDALNLARGMSYKNALAGLDLGGGKAVIIGDPAVLKSEELLLAYGRFVESLGGRYVTACDVGTYVADMDVVARETRWATGRSPENGGAGDSSVLTAYGVFQGMRASAQHLWGDPTLRGRKVGVAGVGKVGRHLVEHLLEDGAEVVITDVRAESVQEILDKHPAGKVTSVADTDALIRTPGLDIYAPCALGGALNDESVPVLTATVVCGAANNQLAHPGVEKDLADRGILYAPDYVVNAGGVIQVADELHGFDFDRCKAKASKIFDTTLAIFARAKADGIPPAAAADRIAEQRMSEALAARAAARAGGARTA
ncbi:Leu/Phe/Val dehydrogenase [Streptomyces sp. NPDC054904]|uniref:Leu/Phe/Val dehydrogenase n=1 Tax=unclassified Streptomyces TaxID=2593676 RepID=UPI002481F424|nr:MULTISPECIES: Glu/Leu/Phe/Val dehydrogenase dimerization domain-containing protein [unclassified Streptomyces]MDA5284151.1 NAD(P)-binding domain-containing protein [Streptomyces sp. Isolate_45]MDX2390315.1 NAD(P)-binding domain-containing protein [Streptomyces sp. DK15]